PRETSHSTTPTSAFHAVRRVNDSSHGHRQIHPNRRLGTGMATIINWNMAFFGYSGLPNVEKLGDIVCVRRQL
ncbi:hypothetical protein BDU57DRAFT_439128, partial [Ampelomyces quisqualis]